VANQLQEPNFTSNKKFFMVRCFKCDPEHGRENHAAAVASGECIWCGDKVEVLEEDGEADWSTTHG